MDSKSSFQFNNDGDVDGEKQCRACLEQHSNHQLHSLDSQKLTILDDGSEETIAAIYHQCTQLLYTPEDGQFKWVCQCCLEKLIDFFQFRKKCIESYSKLKQVKSESIDENSDLVAFGIELDNATIIKKEISADCNADQMGETRLGAHLSGSMQKTARGAAEVLSLVQCELENQDDDENDADLADCNGDGDSNDVMEDGLPIQIDSNKVAAFYTCEKCPRKPNFFKKSRYDAHMRRHMGLKAYKCVECEREFQKIGTLKEHIEVDHYDESKGKKEYICDVDECGKIYNRKKSLRVHMESVHIGRKVPDKICEQCGKVFKNNAALAKHTYTHTRISPHKCDICSKMFATSDKLKVHMMRHNGIKNHVCPTCGLRKVTGHELRAHMRCHSEIYPYDEMFDGADAMEQKNDFDCDSDQSNDKIKKIQTNSNVKTDEPVREVAANPQGQCEQEKLDGNENDADLGAIDDFVNLHYSSDDSEDKVEKELPILQKSSGSKAPEATKTAKNPTGIRNIRPNQNEPPLACDKCPRKFFVQHRYDAHMRRHNGLKGFKCEHCDKAFQKSCTLKAHVEVHHWDESKGKPEYICGIDDCGKKYSRKESLRVHIKLIHMGQKSSASERICEQCGKVFKCNASLIKHTYTHTKVSPFKCEICPNNKMFPTAWKLKEHMFRHNGTKNFVCPICGLRKISGHELRTHMQSHSMQSQYPCDLCQSTFKNKANLRQHKRRVHLQIRPYNCSYCDQSFGKAETLKHHVARHTGEKPHVCQICDKRFIQAVALKTHMKTHNKNN